MAPSSDHENPVPHDSLSRWRMYGDVQRMERGFSLSATAGSPPLAYALSSDFYGDFRMTCRCRYTGDLDAFCGYGVWFRVTSPHGLMHPWGFGYAFQYDIGTSSLKLCKYPNGVDFTPSKKSTLNAEWHDILIEVQGVDIHCSIDDQTVFEMRDWTFWYGAVGFGVWNGASAEVDDIRISSSDPNNG